METYDVIVIGSGPGGYVAAIRSAQLGKRTALIEKYATLGGTCLNVGCIPSKALLDSSEHYHQAKEQFSAHGIGVGTLSIDFPQMISRKGDVVNQTTAGIDFLMKKNNIDVHHGVGAFVDSHTISVTPLKSDSYNLAAKHVIIATGSKPSTLPFIDIDKKRIITSTEALSLAKRPKSLVVIGGGVIGLELGSVYARLGTEVTVIEYMDSLIASMDRSMGKELLRSLKKLGIKFHLKTGVKEVKAAGKSVTIKADNKKGEELTFKAEYCLVSVGRKPFTNGLNLEAAGITTDERGMIPVDEKLRTTQPHIYAIGDVIKGAMLAHKAEEEGVFVAEIINGEHPHIDYNLIPGVVYTWPEVASVGRTEEQLKAEGIEYKAGSFPFKASGRARASMDTDGLVKVLAHAESDEVLGVHMIGPRAADMIAEAVVAMEFRASAEDISRMSHAHPTYTEALKEAALAATGDRALHV
ncbi:MAG: dihydrolipoyl dehydrogenase [Crocinitomicaceae bacterium]|nr:dihydrolipoyl dehydrogenase [Crocinitomicaceae bacterium]